MLDENSCVQVHMWEVSSKDADKMMTQGAEEKHLWGWQKIRSY
jgi:hypothetical protein